MTVCMGALAILAWACAGPVPRTPADSTPPPRASVVAAAESPEVRLHAGAERGRAPVPALPPDSVPDRVMDEIYAPENMTDGAPYMTGRFPRDIICVWFEDEATREERQAAVDAIDGEVVGGVRGLGQGGFYYVRIAGDGSAAALFTAIAELESMPQVSTATPALSIQLHRRRPDDGSG